MHGLEVNMALQERAAAREMALRDEIRKPLADENAALKAAIDERDALILELQATINRFRRISEGMKATNTKLEKPSGGKIQIS
jgi:poly(A) polymerase Pap1